MRPDNGRLANHRRQKRPDGLGDTLRASRIRVNQIVAIQLGVQRDASEEEGHERRSVGRRKTRKQPVKGNGVVPSMRGRRLHPAEEDANPTRLRALDHAREILLHYSDVDVPKAVIGDELQEENLGVRCDRLIEPPKTSCGGVS